MAEIDKSFYSGTDAYSDGDEAENAILQIVRDGVDYEALDEVSWPTLYHLSPVRENICSWYPFAPGSRVLEVGAGCGAVTGALCGRGLDVYSVDLSLRRSTINYERHKDSPDLHLVVGNLNDIAFPEPFDYVLLFGVLEYAGKFTDGDNPYRRFLERLRALLKPEGKLLVAIENRLGLKYFAGAPEDHLGEAFVGLRGYDPQSGIRTFSKSELTGLLEQSGFRGHRFYYPYPDYKLPLEIFTDETLVPQRYGKPFQVFDRDFVALFPPDRVASVLAEDGAAGALANSFLVEAASDERYLDPNRVFYAKLNSGRNERFRIGTKIVGTDAPSRVCKYALNAVAAAHIEQTARNESALNAVTPVLVGRREGAEIVYPYRRENTLEDVLRDAAAQGDAQKISQVFDQIAKLALVRAAPGADHPAFAQWFGDQKRTDPSGAYTDPANVDMVPDNILVTDGGLTLIDCEWVTDFPVPVDFIVWRSVENAWLRIPALERVMPKAALHEKLGIRPADIQVFRAWSWHFENAYVSSGNIGRFAKEVRQSAFTPMQAEQMAQEIRNRDGHIEQLIQSERALKAELSAIHDAPVWPLMKLWLRVRRKLASINKKRGRQGQG